MEYEAAGLRIGVWEPWVWEFSSAPVVVALLPAVGWMVGRFPPVRKGWPLFLAAHIAGATAFSAVHIAGMVGIRKLVYAAVGKTYTFVGPDREPALELLYEWRKDALTYVAIAGVIWLWRNWRVAGAAEAVRPEGAGQRIEVRDGGRVTFLDMPDVVSVEAAGNYVELHAAGRVHLARGTLASFETRLAEAGFLRVHRSRLVNPRRIRSYKSTASGDFEIELDDGRLVTGSRRYREALRGLSGG